MEILTRTPCTMYSAKLLSFPPHLPGGLSQWRFSTSCPGPSQGLHGFHISQQSPHRCPREHGQLPHHRHAAFLGSNLWKNGTIKTGTWNWRLPGQSDITGAGLHSLCSFAGHARQYRGFHWQMLWEVLLAMQCVSGWSCWTRICCDKLNSQWPWLNHPVTSLILNADILCFFL